MRRTVVVTCMAVLASVLLGAPAATAATQPLATWELDEPPGATIMRDSSGNGLNGAIGSEVTTGVAFEGSTGYRFARLVPNQPPPHPEHIVRVGDDPRLDPDDKDFSVEVRYRTTNSFGNLIQKGQATARGGYWKIELPKGQPTCLFRGGTGVTNAVRSSVAIDDGQWHTVRCDRTSDAVSLYVDGVFRGRNTGNTGPIANIKDLYLGGKGECDQVVVTCDYFGGLIDYVRLTKDTGTPPADAPPTASFTTSCADLACTFDGRPSTDAEGTITRHAWTFGDGSTGSGATTSHEYATAGTYPVRLTVTDGGGQTASTTREVTVKPPSQPVGDVTFRDAAGRTGNLQRPAVTVPGTVQPGDLMLLVLSVNRSTPFTDPTGWTVVGSRAGAREELQTRVWSRVAVAGDAGRAVPVGLGTTSKFAMAVSAYAGVDPSAPLAGAASASETAVTARHTTPPVPLGGRLVSFWTDKSSTTTDWSAPSGQDVRAELIGSPSGQVSGLLTDGPGGTGALTATADSASGKAVMWSLSLNPA